LPPDPPSDQPGDAGAVRHEPGGLFLWLEGRTQARLNREGSSLPGLSGAVAHRCDCPSIFRRAALNPAPDALRFLPLTWTTDGGPETGAVKNFPLRVPRIHRQTKFSAAPVLRCAAPHSGFRPAARRPPGRASTEPIGGSQ